MLGCYCVNMYLLYYVGFFRQWTCGGGGGGKRVENLGTIPKLPPVQPEGP